MINQQTFNILAKIREADAIAPLFKGMIFECHPEMSFWAMNDGLATRFRKKRRDGIAERHQLLLQNGYNEAFLATRLGSSKVCGSDDFLDACAAAWTAERIFRDQAIRFPLIAEFDEPGIDMAIRV